MPMRMRSRPERQAAGPLVAALLVADPYDLILLEPVKEQGGTRSSAVPSSPACEDQSRHSSPSFGRFEAGCEITAITHGHPSGYLAAGFLTVVIGALRDGRGLVDAIEFARAPLIACDHHDEVLAAVEHACSEAEHGASPEAVERLGRGWVADQALAIALYCALVADDYGGLSRLGHRVCVTVPVYHRIDSSSSFLALAGQIGL